MGLRDAKNNPYETIRLRREVKQAIENYLEVLGRELRRRDPRPGDPVFVSLSAIRSFGKRLAPSSINNIVKHARAATIEVSLAIEGGQLVLRVKDDGVGFSNDAPRQSGLGLPGMRERVLQIDGHFEVRSEPGEGTELLARAPIPAQEGTDEHVD